MNDFQIKIQKKQLEEAKNFLLTCKKRHGERFSIDKEFESYNYYSFEACEVLNTRLKTALKIFEDSNICPKKFLENAN
jgi:hypothetical protein